MNVRLVGCSHHNAPVELRERLAFTPDQAEAALDRLREQFPQAEVVVLSTCNRVEIYTAGDEPHATPTHYQVAEFLAEFHGLRLGDIFDELFERTGEDAVLHLFTVAAGLDSMVVGEPQILAQVKQAYELARQRHCAGMITHAVFQAAMRVAKRVATETAIARRRVSIPSVAVGDFATQIFETFEDKRVLVIGAGEMADETLRYLRDVGVQHITVVNRSPQRAQQLAHTWGGRAAPWESLYDELVAADLVVSTTGAREPIVTRAQFARVESARYQRPLFVLDLAIPRDFEPAIGDCLGVYLYSIDDLQQACQRNLRQREQELPAAMRIVEEEAQAFMAELHRRTTAPIIRRLRESWQRVTDEELRRLFNKLADLDPRQRREIEYFVERLVNKLLHPPLESLRDESLAGNHHGLLEALKKLFQLRD
jgi:glutamyl-tRNA reductase